MNCKDIDIGINNRALENEKSQQESAIWMVWHLKPCGMSSSGAITAEPFPLTWHFYADNATSQADPVSSSYPTQTFNVKLLLRVGKVQHSIVHIKFSKKKNKKKQVTFKGHYRIEK